MVISVALACYNGSEFILQQLDSLKHQSLQPDEVIICDDASADDTVKLVEDYIENNSLRNWHLSVNGATLGFIENFKKVLSKCNGDIVFLCDQDDVWDSEKIRKMANVMAKDADVLSLACNYDIINRFGYKTEIDFKPMYSAASHMKCGAVKRIRGRILQGNVAQGCACAYRKSVVEEYLSKDAGYNLTHDWALNLLAFERKGLYYLNLPLISYRVYGENAIGAITAKSSVSDRTDILTKLAESTEEAANFVSQLPERYRNFASFVHYRAELVKSGCFKSFIMGFIKYPQYALGKCFLQYCKDFCTLKTRNRND